MVLFMLQQSETIGRSCRKLQNGRPMRFQREKAGVLERSPDSPVPVRRPHKTQNRSTERREGKHEDLGL